MMQKDETTSPRMQYSLDTDFGDFLGEVEPVNYQDNWLNPSCYPEPIFDRFTNWWTSIHFCPVSCLQFRGNTLASGSIEKVIKIWDINLITCPNTLFGHEGPIRCLKFEGSHDQSANTSKPNGIVPEQSPDANHTSNPSSTNINEQIQQHKDLAASKEYSSNVKTQNLNANTVFNTSQSQLANSNPTVSNDLIVSGADDFRIKLWQLSSGYPLLTLKAHTDRVCCIALLPNLILSGSGDTNVNVWKRSIAPGSSTAPISTLKGHKGSIWCIAVADEEQTPEGNTVRRVVTGSADETVKVWDIERGTVINTMVGHKISVASVGVYGDRIVSGSLDRSIMIWDMRQGGQAGPVRKLVEHTGAVGCVQMDDVKVVSGSADECVKIWDLRTLSSSTQADHGTTIRSVNTIRQDTAVACLQFDKARLAVGTRKKLKMFDYSI
eukprot:TRINITY_DN1852_c0_g1_i1.p1 TRINITY_DN1852_c0_g1~~TRINITY_DN1852_c0_g1_i1.p1  ORF type:complete len:437 (-),score=66.81 TRINITY_DN1852_c0_g1_i1:72-1382(-)